MRSEPQNGIYSIEDFDTFEHYERIYKNIEMIIKPEILEKNQIKCFCESIDHDILYTEEADYRQNIYPVQTFQEYRQDCIDYLHALDKLEKEVLYCKHKQQGFIRMSLYYFLRNMREFNKDDFTHYLKYSVETEEERKEMLKMLQFKSLEEVIRKRIRKEMRKNYNFWYKMYHKDKTED